MPSFKIPCPSCEAPVLIKNPNLVGTKVECPKCKYRFKVEEPATDANAKPGETKPADAKAGAQDKKAAKPGKKKLVPILVGVGAVVLLAVVGFSVLGGSDKPKNPGPTGKQGPVNPNNPGGGGDETPPVVPPPVEPPKNSVASSTKNITHLLPGQAVAVYRFNMNRLRESPAYEALVDQQVNAMFQASMGFPVEDVETYIQCFAGDGRDPFGVIKLRSPAKPEDVAAKMALQPKPKAIKTRNLYAVRSNQLATAVGRAFSMRSLLGDVYDRVPMAPADAKEKPLGVCVYDTQHVLIGDHALLEKFLGELDADGYPPFKTVMTSTGEPAPGAPMPIAPGAPPAAPPAVPPAAPANDNRGFTSVDAYRTVEFPLKKALDEMEADRTMTPMFVYAEKFDVRHYDPKLMKKDYSLLSAALDPIATSTRYVSANVVNFSARQLTANIRITLASSPDAQNIAKDQLAPGLTVTAELLKLILQTQVEFRDYTVAGPGGIPMPGFPPMPGGPPGMGMPPGSLGPIPGGSGLGPRPMPGMGGMPGSLGPIPGGSGLGPPPMPGGPPMPGFPPMPGGFPPMPGGMPPGPMDPNQPPQTISHIDLGMTDRQLLIAIDLTWSDEVNRTVVAPRLVGVTNQIKGKMAIFSSEFSWHAVAAAGPKAEVGLKTFPRGTADRKSNSQRWGLAYPPTQRVSLFADLLPYMGRDQLARSINKNMAWYEGKDNLAAAGEWVPELLVPYYPQSAWRATSPFAPNYVLGATNYVAVGGIGRDIVREDPESDKFPKDKVGMTGYGWGSKAAEVTDGLSNTIYLIQTPPGLQQPWIAGGGATVRGFDENDPMAGFRYTHPGRTKQGTYALMGDGSVRWIPADIDPKVLLAMSTRAGGDNAALADVDKTAPKVEAPKPVELKTEPKAPDPKVPDPKKPEEKADPKATDPKVPDPKKPEEKKEPGKVEPTKPPVEKKG